MSAKHALGIEWRNGVLFIGGVLAATVARQGIAAGLIQPKRPRYYRTPEEAEAYRKRRRAEQTACMRRLRARRKAERVAALERMAAQSAEELAVA